MKKTYKQYVVRYYNNDNQLKREYAYANTHNEAIDYIMDKYDVYKQRVVSVVLLKTVTL